MNNKTVTIEISTKTILKILVIFIALLFLYLLQDIIILVFISLILAVALNPFVDKLEKYKIPRWLGTIFVYFVLCFIIFLIIRLIIPPFLEQSQNLINNLPSYLEKLRDYFGRHGYSKDIGIGRGVQKSLENLPMILENPGGIFSTVLGVFAGAFGVITVLVLSFYLVLEDNAVKESLVKYLSPKSKERILNVYKRVRDKLGRWVRGQIILSLFVGALVLLGLLIINVKYALALAIFAAFTELIPFVGPFIGIIPALIITAAVSPTKAIWVIILYVVVQQLENHILTPQVMKRAVGLNPIIVITAMLVGGKLYGILGVLLAIPLISAGSVIIEEIIKFKKTAK